MLERSKRSYLDPARVYGAHDAEGGGPQSSFICLGAKPKQPETVPTFQFVPINELLARLHAHPTSHSIIEFNGKKITSTHVCSVARCAVRAQAMPMAMASTNMLRGDFRGRSSENMPREGCAAVIWVDRSSADGRLRRTHTQ